MKKFTLMAVAAIALLFGFTQSGSASPIPNAFVSSDGNSQVYCFGNQAPYVLETGWYFGVYDHEGSYSTGVDLLQGGDSNVSAGFTVSYVDDGYQLDVNQGIGQGGVIDLGEAETFSFYYKDPSDNVHVDFAITDIGSNSYGFNRAAGGGSVTGVDLRAIPIPAAVWLLGSAVLGLVVIRRRLAE
mgnify:CR=1 FL=1